MFPDMDKQTFIADVRAFLEKNNMAVYRLARLSGVEPRSLWGFLSDSEKYGLSLNNFFKLWDVIYGGCKPPTVRTLKTQFVV